MLTCPTAWRCVSTVTFRIYHGVGISLSFSCCRNSTKYQTMIGCLRVCTQYSLSPTRMPCMPTPCPDAHHAHAENAIVCF